jgi:plasmid maintenance system antidote protein VapI
MLVPHYKPARGNSVDVHVGSRVMVAMEQRKMTHCEIAAVLNVDAEIVVGLCSGEYRIGAMHLYELSKALDVQVQWFFSGLYQND